MHSPFGKVKHQSRASQPSQLIEATLRDFGGGLNLVDNDITIKSNYAKVLDNMHRDADGGMSLRWGTSYKYNVSPAVTGNLLELAYFSDHIIAFTTTGQIAKIDSAGVVTAIWNTAIAAALPGAPAAWSTGLVTIDTTEFKGEMVAVNGVDKPLLIKANLTVQYLADVATGSNIFVPVGRYVTTVSDYTVIAGVAATPYEIHISAKGTSGTWAGDPDPNDGLSINVGAYAPAAGGEIRGVNSFRNFLIVHFAKQSVIIELGVYDEDGNHTPKPNDTLPDYGIISHRMGVALTSDFVFADEQGIQTAKRNIFGGAIETAPLSDKITPEYAGLTPFAQADRFKSFALYNKLEKRIMYFLYMATGWTIYTMTFEGDLKKVAWNSFSGWEFTCGVLSGRSKVYLGKGTRVYQYGNLTYANEDYDADEMLTSDGNWLTATAYVVGDRRTQGGIIYIALVNHTSGVFATDLDNNLWEVYLGLPIEFDWELPWSDINTRMKKKQVKYIGMDTEGTAAFTISAFVDNQYKDKLTGDYDPIVTMDFVAGDSPGYGGGNQPYGGGRRAIDERLWGYPIEFKLFKLRVHGSSRGRLKFSSLTILYKNGNYHR